MNRWFLADTHFFHSNIIEYENRPFADAEEMNRKLIQNIKARVKPGDEVYFLGDFLFYGGYRGLKVKAQEIIKELPGKWIFLRGNHDNNNTLNTKIIRLVLQLGGVKINCVHDPINVSAYYPINLVGHVHGAWKAQRYIKGKHESILINTSVELWDYAPISWNEISKFYAKCLREKKKLPLFDKEKLRQHRASYKRSSSDSKKTN